MSEGHIAAISKTNKRKNRRKKRRTQDVSDSSSDSSSDSENSSVEDNDTKLETMEKAASDVEDVALSDIDMDKEEDEAALDDKKASRKEGSVLSPETVDKLNKVGLTTSDLTGNNGIHLGNIDLNKMSATLDESSSKLLENNKDKNGLKNQYLSMLFESYGDDMNELRNAPDFTSKTLVMLANVLKDGGDMFDLETLKTIVEDK
ncbi:Rsa3 [Kluyveromyces lactis]|nr:Rsa3 [Kluyveromyces lactis]